MYSRLFCAVSFLAVAQALAAPQQADPDNGYLTGSPPYTEMTALFEVVNFTLTNRYIVPDVSDNLPVSSTATFDIQDRTTKEFLDTCTIPYNPADPIKPRGALEVLYICTEGIFGASNLLPPTILGHFPGIVYIPPISRRNVPQLNPGQPPIPRFRRFLAAKVPVLPLFTIRDMLGQCNINHLGFPLVETFCSMRKDWDPYWIDQVLPLRQSSYNGSDDDDDNDNDEDK